MRKGDNRFVLTPVVKDGLQIRSVCSIDEEFDIGDWDKYYPEIEIKYNLKTFVYPNISVIIKNEDEIVGYFIATPELQDTASDDIEKGALKLRLIEFFVYHTEHAKPLLEYLVSTLDQIGCRAIEIVKAELSTPLFRLIRENYQTVQDGGNLYIINHDYNPVDDKKHLKIYDGDKISVEDLYYLYDLGFEIGENDCKFVYGGEDIISLDRKTGGVTFLKSVLNENKTVSFAEDIKKVIHLICYCYENGKVEEIYLNEKLTPVYVDAFTKDGVVIFEDGGNLRVNFQLLNQVYFNLGYDFVYAFKAVENDSLLCLPNSFLDKIDIAKAIGCQKKYINLKGIPLKEMAQRVKDSRIFNERLSELKEFEFQIGNSFSGIKKLKITFGVGVEIKHNGENQEEKIYDKYEVLLDLKALDFYNWQPRYEFSSAETDKNWRILLVFENETIEYSGLGDYPNCWMYLCEFVEKYAFKLREKHE